MHCAFQFTSHVNFNSLKGASFTFVIVALIPWKFMPTYIPIEIHLLVSFISEVSKVIVC